MSTHNLKPLSEVIKDLKSEGFAEDFIYRDGKIMNMNKEKTYSAEDLKVINIYRFEGDSEPDMMTILYALEANDGHRGTIANAYGANSDAELGEFMKNVKEVNRD